MSQPDMAFILCQESDHLPEVGGGYVFNYTYVGQKWLFMKSTPGKKKDIKKAIVKIFYSSVFFDSWKIVKKIVPQNPANKSHI
jgi:hypothetical protein